MKRFFVASVVAIAIFCVSPASAQDVQQPPEFAIYVDMGDIHGSSTHPQHVDWIEAWSITQSVTAANLRNACTLEFTKGLDAAGPNIWRAAVMGSHMPEVRIDFVRQVGDTSVSLYMIDLHEARVTAISTTAESAFVEKVQLSADTVTLSYFKPRPDGTVGGTVTTKWDCSQFGRWQR